MDIVESFRTTRRRLVAVALGGAAGLLSVLSRSPREASAISYCKRIVNYRISTTASCRATFGPPRCDESPAYIESPNGAYYNQYVCDCLPQDCACTPRVVQARVGVCNSGICSQECVFS